MRNIYLVGHMASGKTTVGQLLAETLNLNFVDTDCNVERLYGKSINQIFKKEGELQFRIFETAVLLQTTLVDNTIVSTGGGILKRMRNGVYMKDFGFVIYLELSVEEQAKRLLADSQLSKRPIVKDCKDSKELFEKLNDLHEKRNVTYEYFADYIIDVNKASPAEIVQRIIDFLNQNKLIGDLDFLDSFAGRMQYNPYKRLRRNENLERIRGKVEPKKRSSKRKEYVQLDNE
ncbi:hypothetical protein CJP74_06110 [Psittacicella melopsittaci]|uniref:Shikimate kinase n=1 Tax=Psittacicella melopsittaci TaxID=2028576 RepID=A0A3A1Y3B2_9GAMM|nr:shikimate kinase [Psittacicella melopsittaci]RIY31931.1 hypothetical protein CJP74_06110 [Psittacicella melopsittaci]